MLVKGVPAIIWAPTYWGSLIQIEQLQFYKKYIKHTTHALLDLQ